MKTTHGKFVVIAWCFAACAGWAGEPGSGSDADLIRAALERLNRQGSEVARSDAEMKQLVRDGMRQIDAALPSDNPMKGMYAGPGGSNPFMNVSNRSGGGALTGGSCKTDLRHLASKLPRYPNSSVLESARNRILETDLLQALRDAKARGYTPAQVASDTVQQAEAFRQARMQAKACFNGSNADPRREIEQLESGAYDNGSINGMCAENYVMSYYAEVANEASAVSLTCLARANP